MSKAKNWISLILVTRNHGQLLSESILSVIDQSHIFIEFIIIDDSSEDSSLISKIVNYDLGIVISKRFSRFKFIQNDLRLGLVKSLNMAMEFVTSDLVCFLSGDDMLPIEALSSNLDHYLLFGGNIVFGKTKCIGIHNNFIEEANLSNHKKIDLLTLGLKRDYKSNINIVFRYVVFGGLTLLTGALFEVDVIRQVGGFNEDYLLLEDAPLIEKLIMNNYIFKAHKTTTYFYKKGVGFSSGKIKNHHFEYLIDLGKYYLTLLDYFNGFYSFVIKGKFYETRFAIMKPHRLSLVLISSIFPKLLYYKLRGIISKILLKYYSSRYNYE